MSEENSQISKDKELYWLRLLSVVGLSCQFSPNREKWKSALVEVESVCLGQLFLMGLPTGLPGQYRGVHLTLSEGHLNE